MKNREQRRHITTWVFPGAGLLLLALSNVASAACLLKPTQAKNVGTVYTLMIAPAPEVPTYVSMGFVPTACPPDLSLIRVYVAQLCADPGNGSVTAIDAQALMGLPRAQACTSARAGLVEAGG